MKVAVIGGGTSPEAAISRSSATRVLAALQARHDAVYIEFDAGLYTKLVEFEPDVVFPVLHGVPGEDGSVQGFLEVMGLPYIGSGMTASALAIDKFQAKCVWREHGLPVLPMKLLDKTSATPSVIDEIEKDLGSAIVLKPRSQGSAVGVRLLSEGSEIEVAIRESLESHNQLIVEPLKIGREITVAVLERAGTLEALPIIEILVLEDGEWYDFTNRYKQGASRHVIDPFMPATTALALKRIAVTAHQLLGCRDLSRSDFILDSCGHVWLLEVNTIPGMTPTSLFPDAARAAGVEFPELMEILIANAMSRIHNTATSS